MPFKFETNHVPMPEGKDRRKKLTKEEREFIRVNPDNQSQRALARQFNVSRRLIGFIVNPDSLIKNLEQREARGGWRQYYQKDKSTKSIREHRQYKQEVLSHE